MLAAPLDSIPDSAGLRSCREGFRFDQDGCLSFFFEFNVSSYA